MLEQVECFNCLVFLGIFFDTLLSGKPDVAQRWGERDQGDEKMAQEKETAENAWPVLSKKIFLDTRIPLKIQSQGIKQ